MRKTSNNDLKSTRTARSGSVGYTTVANAMPASQAAAPYLGQTHVAGSYTQDDVANRIAGSKGAHCGAEEVKRVLNAVGNYLLDRMPEELCSIDIGFAHVRPAIGGKFPSKDAAFDASRNCIYVLATPSAEIRDALATGTPTRMDTGGGKPEVGNVTWGGESLTLKSDEPFDVLGNALTLDGGDESAELSLPDGTSVSVSLEPKTSGNWQRLVGRLEHSVDACEGAVLIVRTHGYDADAGLKTVKSKPLTVLAGAVVPEPTITGAKTRGESDGSVNIAGGILDVEGTNLGTATAVELHSDVEPTGEASLWQTVPATYADGKLTTGELDFDEKPSDDGFVRVVTAGGSALYPITYCAH